jgi:CheY-like chemotaxis protein
MRKLKSVLGADDDPDVCAVVRASLRLTGGIDVRMTGSGEHLIDLALEHPPDLVLLDVMMPGMDGAATLRRMRENPLLHTIPAIFLTARVMPVDLRQVLPLGALGLISKPFDPLKLGDQILGMWNKVQMAVAAPNSTPAAQVHVEGLAVRFLRRAVTDIVLLREKIDQAGRGDAAALKEVEHIGHKMHGSAAMLGFHRVSAIGEAIEHLAAGVIADSEAHGPIAESALVQQISACIEQLAAAVEGAAAAAAAAGSQAAYQEAGSPIVSSRRESFR